MKYKGQLVTFDNYKDVLSEFSIDVLDEVRSAILDDTPIGPYIDVCANDPYRLQQIRLAMKEFSDKRILNLPSGNSLKMARELLREGIVMDPIEKYLVAGLPESYYETLLVLLSKGIVLSDNLDLGRVREEFLGLIAWSYEHEIEVSDIVMVNWMYLEYAVELVKIRGFGKPIDIFLSDQWHFEVLKKLPLIAQRSYYSQVVGYMSYKTTEYQASGLIAMAAAKFDFGSIDWSLYSGYQLDWILQAYSNGVDYQSMLNPELSNNDLAALYGEGLLNKPDSLKRWL